METVMDEEIDEDIEEEEDEDDEMEDEDEDEDEYDEEEEIMGDDELAGSSNQVSAADLVDNVSNDDLEKSQTNPDNNHD